MEYLRIRQIFGRAAAGGEAVAEGGRHGKRRATREAPARELSVPAVLKHRPAEHGGATGVAGAGGAVAGQVRVGCNIGCDPPVRATVAASSCFAKR